MIPTKIPRYWPGIKSTNAEYYLKDGNEIIFEVKIDDRDNKIELPTLDYEEDSLYMTQ